MSGPTRRILTLGAAGLCLVLIQLAPAPAAADPGTVLIYGPSMTTETPNEQTVAEAEGHTVTVVTAIQWAAMTTEEFAAFDALVIGDDGCDGDETQLDAVLNSRTTWSPAATGNITLNTFDTFFHNDGQGAEFVANSINFAESAAGTGLYFSLGCYYEGDGDVQALTLMDQFGSYTIDGESGDTVAILRPDHPMMAGLTSGGLSDWGSSVHQHFISFPSTFDALAQEIDGFNRPVILTSPHLPPPPPPAPAPSTSPPPVCKGKAATVVGGPDSEVLTGTLGNDVIAGLDGNDRIQAGGGNDLVCGGEGNDKLKGGAGKDTLLGQGGNDLLAGGGGTGDVCKGGPGKDTAKANCEKGKA
jgi:Ca2+-binding RTX toxin-like protein